MYDLSKAFTALTAAEKVAQAKVIIQQEELAEELIPVISPAARTRIINNYVPGEILKK